MALTGVMILPTTPTYNNSSLECKLQSMVKKLQFTPPQNQFNGVHQWSYNQHSNHISNSDSRAHNSNPSAGQGNPGKPSHPNKKPQGYITCTSTGCMPIPPGNQGRFCSAFLHKGIACCLHPSWDFICASITWTQVTEKCGSNTFNLPCLFPSTLTWSTQILFLQQRCWSRPSLVRNRLANNWIRTTHDYCLYP